MSFFGAAINSSLKSLFSLTFYFSRDIVNLSCVEKLFKRKLIENKFERCDRSFFK